MKRDVLIVPNDTLVLGTGRGAAFCRGRPVDGRLASDLFLGILRSAFVASGQVPPDDLRITAQLAAKGFGGRIEPLYPVPDDLVVEPGAKDAVGVQAAYLEAVNPEVVRHDLGGLRLLVASSRNADCRPFEAYLTRRGVRVWADRKAQRLAEGDHYLPFSKLFEVEHRRNGDDIAVHLALKPDIGFLISFETPDDTPALSLPITVKASSDNRTVRLEEAQFPLPTLESKSRKRWRICLLSNLLVANTEWPSWVDGDTLTTRAPLPEGGKVVAVARRRGEGMVGAPFRGVPGSAQTVIPVGTTLFIEFEEPTLIEQSAEILAGGS